MTFFLCRCAVTATLATTNENGKHITPIPSYYCANTRSDKTIRMGIYRVKLAKIRQAIVISFFIKYTVDTDYNVFSRE